MHVIERLQNFMPKVLDGEQMGMVFNMAYGIQGESRYTHLPSLLEMLGIPYVGSNPAGHALALDKVITKIIMQKHGLSTPEFWVFNAPTEDMSDVKYPVIVKPKMESVSFGLKVVYNEQDLREAVSFIIAEFQQQALVEQFIRGREFCVGILGNNPVEAFPILEVDLENDPDAIQTVDDKRKKPRGKICPAEISEDLAKKMIDESIAAFKALQLRDFSRVDIRLSEEGKVYLLEINSMASLGKTGSYVAAAKVAGYDYSALVNKILDVASVRYFATTSRPETVEKSDKKVPMSTRIRGFLRNRSAAMEKLLKSMVDTNSYVRNIEGVNKLGLLMKKELAQLGFTQEVYPQIEVGNQLYFTNSLDGEIDTLILGNLDNTTKTSKHKSFRQDAQKIYGTGVWVHKGGLVALLASLQSLRFVRKLRKHKIGILLTTDDSLQGRFAKTLVQAKSQQAKRVIGLHGANISGSLVTSRSGAAVYKCHVHQNDSSAEQIVPIASAFSKLIGSWSDLSSNEHSLLVAPSSCKFESSLVSPYVSGEVKLSVRFNETEHFSEINEKICKKLPKKYLNSLVDWQVEGGLRRPPFLSTEKGKLFWNKVKDIAKSLDIRIVEEHRWSSSDICFVNAETTEVIDGFGPVGENAHNDNEYILSHSLRERALLLAMLIIKA